MAALAVEVVRNADGGYSLVSIVDGHTVTFATVNPSQVAEGRAAAGLPALEAEQGDADAGEE